MFDISKRSKKPILAGHSEANTKTTDLTKPSIIRHNIYCATLTLFVGLAYAADLLAYCFLFISIL
jgi:hypothetical protein